MGFTLLVVVQALMNLSVVLSLAPNKGIPLPFISYGSSSLIASLASLGLLLAISKEAASSHPGWQGGWEGPGLHLLEMPAGTEISVTAPWVGSCPGA